MTKVLHEILIKVGIAIPQGLPNPSVHNIVCDSRSIKDGDLFVGYQGENVDGGIFWKDAISKGAVAAIIGKEAAVSHPPNNSNIVIIVEKTDELLGDLASFFWDNPSYNVPLIGITGTNGKTTIAYLIEFLSNSIGNSSGVFGTLENRWSGYREISTLTTCFADSLQSKLASARDSGTKLIAMEVSSHALVQNRVRGCIFAGTIFTNLTQDHLDYHLSMHDYFEAKALLFSTPFFNIDSSLAVINIDDNWGSKLAKRMKGKCWRASMRIDKFDSIDVELKIKVLSQNLNGTKGIIRTPFGQGSFISPLIGDFNLMNLLQAVGALVQQGLPLNLLLKEIKNFPGVPGRMERINPLNKSKANQVPIVLIDYAHTPDGLRKALIASRSFSLGQIICVFGCGGDRDRSKRSKMGSIASDLADLIILTSDNPRSEDQAQIFDDIQIGIDPKSNYLLESDRAAAISKAISKATPKDIVLIAGKGHEDYQILGDKIIHFNDREQAEIAIKNYIN